jgi:hypothetical protein
VSGGVKKHGGDTGRPQHHQRRHTIHDLPTNQDFLSDSTGRTRPPTPPSSKLSKQPFGDRVSSDPAPAIIEKESSSPSSPPPSPRLLKPILKQPVHDRSMTI